MHATLFQITHKTYLGSIQLAIFWLQLLYTNVIKTDKGNRHIKALKDCHIFSVLTLQNNKHDFIASLQVLKCNWVGGYTSYSNQHYNSSGFTWDPLECESGKSILLTCCPMSYFGASDSLMLATLTAGALTSGGAGVRPCGPWLARLAFRVSTASAHLSPSGLPCQLSLSSIPAGHK